MPKFKVIGGTWGEGYELGQIIELDTDASLRRLELGELEPVMVSAAAPEVAPEEPAVEEKPKKSSKK